MEEDKYIDIRNMMKNFGFRNLDKCRDSRMYHLLFVLIEFTAELIIFHQESLDIDHLDRSLDVIRHNADQSGIQELASAPQCIICMDASREIMFQCGHAVTCQVCSTNLIKCPMCDVIINKKQRIYL